MKKAMILAVGIFTALATLAQESTYKQQGGENNLEVQFAPFGNSPIGINGIRYRKFNSATKAFRLNVFASFNSDSEITQQGNSDADIEELKNTNTLFALNIRPGFEKHLAGTNRLSPYFGVEFDLALQTSSAKQENDNLGEVEYVKVKNQNGFWRAGANAIAGFDFYVAKSLYLGAEIGFGFSYQKNSDIKTEFSTSGMDDPDPINRGGAFSLGPNANTAIRLGYIF